MNNAFFLCIFVAGGDPELAAEVGAKLKRAQALRQAVLPRAYGGPR
jgi:hypothetical protein